MRDLHLRQARPGPRSQIDARSDSTGRRVRAEVARRPPRDRRRGCGRRHGWESAHLIIKYGVAPMRRLYFMQDYEPYFYGHGAEYELAAMTYDSRSVGSYSGDARWDGAAGDRICRATSCRSAATRPCTACRITPVPGNGIVFYCRPDFPRRGYQLACVALMLFHRLHPDQEIHVYGGRRADSTSR